MPIRTAAGQKPEKLAEGAEPGCVFRVVPGVPYLDAVETEGNERLEFLAPPFGSGVRPDDNRSSRVCESDRIRDLQPSFGNETRPAGTEVAVECLAGALYVAAANQRSRNMRTTDGAASSLFHHCLELDVHSELAKSFDNSLCADLAAVAKDRQLGLHQVGSGNVECQQVNLTRTIMSTELDTRYHPNPERFGSELRFAHTPHRVVIGERNCLETGCAGGLDDCRRSERAVGGGRMHVQVYLSREPVGLPGSDHFT